MKEIILRSKKFPNLILQLFNDFEFGMLGENTSHNEDPDGLIIDNVHYAYEMYKLLREADKRKSFDGLKNKNNNNADIEEILI